LLQRLVRWRVNPVWDLVALSLTAVIGLEAIALNIFLGGRHHMAVLISQKQAIPPLLFNIFCFTLTE
jgi:hypothetical protein